MLCRNTRALASRLAVLVVAALAFAGGGCLDIEPSFCTRNSDCALGLLCGMDGQCAKPPDVDAGEDLEPDAAADVGDEPDGGVEPDAGADPDGGEEPDAAPGTFADPIEYIDLPLTSESSP